MNPYLKNLNKIEFVITNACTGKCRHCSQGDHTGCDRMDPVVAAEAVEKICDFYDIRTVMTFGGEALLNREAVYAVMKAALRRGVPKRQVITNGYFSKDPEVIREAAEKLANSGVNDLRLSVDAFHQETIPLDVVMTFAQAAKECSIPLQLQPAWLVSREDRNPYNEKTREFLAAFHHLDIPVGEGNVIFPEGNARKYLAEYFGDVVPENPYVEDPRDVRCVSFDANGDVLGGNVYRKDILAILRDYTP